MTLATVDVKSYTDVVNLLIENGADVNIQNNKGATALILCMLNNTDI